MCPCLPALQLESGGRIPHFFLVAAKPLLNESYEPILLTNFEMPACERRAWSSMWPTWAAVAATAAAPT